MLTQRCPTPLLPLCAPPTGSGTTLAELVPASEAAMSCVATAARRARSAGTPARTASRVMRPTAASIAAGSAPGPCTMSSSVTHHLYSGADEGHAFVSLIVTEAA